MKEGKATAPERTVASRTQRTIKCFNCKAKDHRAIDCKEPPSATDGRGSHLADDSKSESLRSTSEVNLIQPTIDTELYVISVAYEFPEDKTRQCCVKAIIDTGSPISLIKQKYVLANYCLPVASDYHYRGVNNSRIEWLGIFERDIYVNDVSVRVKFFVIPDATMSAAALLGRDFLSNPAVKVEIDETLRISQKEFNSPAKNDFAEQLLNIEYMDPMEDGFELNISPNIFGDAMTKLKEIYTDAYLTSKKSQLPIYEPEKTICLKHEHEKPISFWAQRLAYADRIKLGIILDNLTKERIIRESTSPYANPIMLVRKKNKELRLCVDYRELNKITIKDNFPTPLIEDQLDRLKGKKYFISPDLKNGFHHIRMAESSIKYTAFITPMGQFEYLKMPFGLTNAPRVFQRYVHSIFKLMIKNDRILVYMDDLLIATDELEEHFDILHMNLK